MTSIRIRILPFLLLLVQPCAYAGNNVYEACKVMTAKLAAYYSIEVDMLTRGGRDPIRPMTLKEAEDVVFGAYLLKREELEAKWPTFHDWSVLTVMQGSRLRRTALQLRDDAFLECVERYR